MQRSEAHAKPAISHTFLGCPLDSVRFDASSQYKGHNSLGLGIAMSRSALGAVSPNTSLMSISPGFCPSGSSHVKEWMRLAT